MDIYALFSVIPQLHLITFDADRRMIRSNDNIGPLFSAFLSTEEYMEMIFSHGKNHDTPFVLAAYIGFVWEAIYEKKDGKLMRVHVLGPIFYSPYSDKAMEHCLRQYESLGMSFSSKHKLIAQMKELPVMKYSQFAHYGMMLHYLVNGQRISMNDFDHMQDTSFLATAPFPVASDVSEDRDVVYENIYHFENLLLSEVAQGQDSLYAAELNDMVKKGSLASVPTEYANVVEPSRSRKDSLLILNALECHKAIQAGVLISTAYRTQEAFIEEIENTHSPLGMNQLHQDIHQTYCALVQDAMDEKKQYSPMIRKCMTYLKNNITSGVTTAQLADQTGYEPYYLNRLFKTEVGISPKQYYRDLRMHYAARMLLESEISIADAAEYLHYSSYTHFCSDFKAVMNCTPTDYRRSHR